MKKGDFFDSQFRQLNSMMSASAWLMVASGQDGSVHGRGHIAEYKVKRQFGFKSMLTRTHFQHIVIPENPTYSPLKAVPSVISGSSTCPHFFKDLTISQYLYIKDQNSRS